MRVHFFTRIDLAYRSFFRSYSTLQNLRAVKILSLISFIISVSVRLIVYLNNLPLKDINNLQEFNWSIWFSTILSPVFYFASIYLIKNFRVSNKFLLVAQWLVVLFAFFIITNGMRSTFFAMHNPRNTLVMYMLGLVVAGVFFTFEYFETILVAFITGLCFTLMLPLYVDDFYEVLKNNLVSLVLLTVFYCISRYAFSYRADYYLKLKAIEEKNLEIQTASLLKNEILGIVAHDLRNPLAAIKTIAMMMEVDKTINADNQDNVHMIKASCDKATTIINDLLETAHNEAQGDYDFEEIELNQFLLIIVDEWVKNTHGRVNVLYYGNDKPVYAHINTEKMQRVMDNLISNAIKFSGERDHIEISLKVTNEQAIINVKDFGMGIPAELQPYIFDRFSRASRKGIRGEESVGLGLSIVKQIIRKHGGEIDVHSTGGRGTTFTIRLAEVKPVPETEPVKANMTQKMR